jgi:branched-chain amino acid transport system ATP-binding protein
MTALLATKNLDAGYGDFQALFGIDFTLQAGEAVALIGANGAGKSTFLRAICGLNRACPEAVMFEGKPIGGMAASRITQLGIALVPEGRKLFRSLTVEENLTLGAASGRKGSWNLRRVFDLFPVLAEKRGTLATLLSGGQQQMVAIGRALMTNPRVLLCDEISLGLAPVTIRSVYQALPAIRDEGVSLVIVEQDVTQVLRFADRLYCLRRGTVVLQGRSDTLNREAIRHAYFGDI